MASTVTPNSGDAAGVGGTCGGSLVGSTYITAAVTINCTVVASFNFNLALSALHSRKTHNTAGTFDLAIDTTPLTNRTRVDFPGFIPAG